MIDEICTIAPPSPPWALLAIIPRATEREMARIPHAEVARFGKEARHEILREADPVRTRALAAIDAFLDRVAPA